MEADNLARFKKFPSRSWLEKEGKQILAGKNASDTLKFEIQPKSKNRTICHLYAKHEDVVGFLGPEFSNRLDLSLYDKALNSGGGGAEFFISAKDKSKQWELLINALSMMPSIDRHISSDNRLAGVTASYFESKTSSMTEEALSIVRENLGKSPKEQATIDPVKDYGYLVAFLMVRDVVGLKMPRSTGILFHVYKLLTKVRGQKNHTLSDIQIRQANELVSWIEIMFGHLFMNPHDHNRLLLFASRLVSKRYIKVILSSLDQPIPGSLIDRMKKIQPSLDCSDEDFEALVVNIVMELVGSFQYLTGRAFAGVVDTVTEQFRDSILPSENPLLVFNEKVTTNPRAMIDEALRHNSPTGFIFRTASASFRHKGNQINKGDLVCLLCDVAVKDEAVFSNPDEFCDIETAVDRQSSYLAFGSPDTLPSPFSPSGSHHPCFGQYMGRIMIVEMLKGLEDLLPFLEMNSSIGKNEDRFRVDLGETSKGMESGGK